MANAKPELREGRRLLKRLIGKARAEARKDRANLDFRPTSLLGQSVTDRVEEKHLDAILVYEDGPGRWYGDLVLKGLPTGVPNVFGTPIKMPRASRKEALKDGYRVLVGIIASIQERNATVREEPMEDKRVFQIFDVEFVIDGTQIDVAATLAGMVKGGHDKQDAVKLFERSLYEITGGEKFIGKMFDEASSEKKAKFMAGMSAMVALGLFSYPVKKNPLTN